MSAGLDTDNRAKIFDAALRLLSDEGPSALTVRRVSTEAGCSTIGLYTWFGGKDGLIDAIWIEGFQSFVTALRRVKPMKGPMGRLHAQSYAYRRWALKHPRHYKVMFLGVIADHVPGVEAQEVAQSAFNELLRGVDEAIADGDIVTENARAVAMSMWGVAHGLVSIELLQSGPPDVANCEQNLGFSVAYDTAIAAIMKGFLHAT